jgi:hypothetical protein
MAATPNTAAPVANSVEAKRGDSDCMTHEQYIAAIRDIVLPRVTDSATRAKLASAKLVYGAGTHGVRGVTYYGAWQNGEPHPLEFIEVTAQGEQNPLQLAGTTIHEFAHALAGLGSGHSKAWKDAAHVLGLVYAEAAGQEYAPAHFAPEVLEAIRAIPEPCDGKPQFNGGSGGLGLGIPLTGKFKPCPLGIGTRGGKSRGAGSGSRLRKFTCGCNPPVIARVARDEFNATCNECGTAFKRAESQSEPPEPVEPNQPVEAPVLPSEPADSRDSLCPQCGKSECECQSTWAESINQTVATQPAPIEPAPVEPQGETVRWFDDGWRYGRVVERGADFVRVKHAGRVISVPAQEVKPWQ